MLFGHQSPVQKWHPERNVSQFPQNDLSVQLFFSLKVIIVSQAEIWLISMISEAYLF